MILSEDKLLNIFAKVQLKYYCTPKEKYSTVKEIEEYLCLLLICERNSIEKEKIIEVNGIKIKIKHGIILNDEVILKIKNSKYFSPKDETKAEQYVEILNKPYILINIKTGKTLFFYKKIKNENQDYKKNYKTKYFNYKERINLKL